MGILSFFRRTKTARSFGGERAAQGAVPPAAPQRVETRAGPPAAPAGKPLRAGGVSALTRLLLNPRATEKATISGDGRYTFLVDRAATKPDIRKAVEQQFNVRVAGVRVLNVRGKARRRGRIEGRVPGHRKAMVTLRAGERIDLSGA